MVATPPHPHPHSPRRAFAPPSPARMVAIKRTSLIWHPLDPRGWWQRTRTRTRPPPHSFAPPSPARMVAIKRTSLICTSQSREDGGDKRGLTHLHLLVPQGWWQHPRTRTHPPPHSFAPPSPARMVAIKEVSLICTPESHKDGGNAPAPAPALTHRLTHLHLLVPQGWWRRTRTRTRTRHAVHLHPPDPRGWWQRTRTRTRTRHTVHLHPPAP